MTDLFRFHNSMRVFYNYKYGSLLRKNVHTLYRIAMNVIYMFTPLLCLLSGQIVKFHRTCFETDAGQFMQVAIFI